MQEEATAEAEMASAAGEAPPAAPAAPAAAAPTAAPAAAAGAEPAETAAPTILEALPPTTLDSANAQSDATITEPATQDAPPTAALQALEPTTAPLSYSQPADGQMPTPAEPETPGARPALQPIRLIQIGLASAALLLGLGAFWVRRQGH